VSGRLVVYLDTNVPSDLAKASLGLPRLTKAQVRRGRTALDFFASLVDSRVAIFPDCWSRKHEVELLDDPEFQSACRKIAARLSRGVWFHSPPVILSNQLERVFLAHLDGTDYCPTWVEALTNDPSALIPKWTEEGARHSYAATSDEARARRRELKRLSVEYRQERAAVGGRARLSFEELRAANAQEYVHRFVTAPLLLLAASRAAVALRGPASHLIEAAARRRLDGMKVVQFLSSEAVLRIPVVDIWASIESSAEIDERSRDWKRGDEFDLEALSSVLPYCDAVFCDRNMKRILSRRQIDSRYGTRIYSMADFEEFRSDVEAGPAGPLRAMDPRVGPIVERWDHVTEYLRSVVRACDSSSWANASPYPGWTYKDLLAHLATGYTLRLLRLRGLVEKGRLGPEPHPDDANAENIARHRDSSPEAIVEEMVRQRSEVRRLMGLLRPEHLEVRTTVWRPRGQAPREGTFLEALQRGNEHDLEHAADLAPIMRWPVAPPEI
jgi:hypothetical protein